MTDEELAKWFDVSSLPPLKSCGNAYVLKGSVNVLVKVDGRTRVRSLGKFPPDVAEFIASHVNKLIIAYRELRGDRLAPSSGTIVLGSTDITKSGDAHARAMVAQQQARTKR